MSAQPPESDHDWRRDQSGRWYYLDGDNRRVDATAPRTTGPTTNVLSYRPNVPTAGTRYQLNPPGPQSGLGPARGSQPISIPAATNPAQQLGVGRGRGVPASGVPQSPPVTGYPQQLGGGRGQLLPTGPNPPFQPANTQAGAGRGRGNFTNNAQPAGIQLPALQQQQMIATREQWGTLHEDYKVRATPRKFFRLGKVFLSQHTEPFGQNPGRTNQSTLNTSNNDVFAVAFGELVFTKVRRFIVVREGPRSCSVLAITTHNGRGAAQSDASEHGVVYTGASAPPQRLRGEGGILPVAVRIDPFDKDDALHPASRVNYGKVYNLEHNVKVKPYGTVNNQYMHVLITQWTQVYMGRTGNLAQLAFRTPGQPTLQALGFTPTQINAVLRILTKRGAVPYEAITSYARASAEIQLADEDRTERSVKRFANHVVDLILAGMTYPVAISHVKLLAANEEADDDDDDDDDDEDDEDEDDGADEEGEDEAD